MMSVFLGAMAEAVFLAFSLSLDSFTAGFAYGTDKIKIPMLSAHIINLICTGVTGLSMLAGVLLKPYLPERLIVTVAFLILFLMGLTKLLDGIMKSIIRKYDGIKKEIRGSLFHFKFVLSLYANPIAADIDQSKSISPAEAVLLALSLSLDGIAVGVGAALAEVNGIMVFFWSLLTNMLFLMSGYFLGTKIAKKKSVNLSWLSGGVLIGLAISKIFKF